MIRTDLKESNSYIVDINKQMAEMGGRVFEVRKAYASHYELKGDTNYWAWSHDTLTLLPRDANELLDMLISGSIDEKTYKELREQT